MRSRRILLLVAPTVVSLFLLQSYLWVPTFDDQARGDPRRLTRYISGSIGDAAILNPTLSADGGSSEINNLVFEGLIDRDADLSFRGRVAESWRVFEEAYLAADPALRLADGAAATPETLRDRIQAAVARGGLERIETIEVLPGRTEQVQVPDPTAPPPARGAAPPQVALTVRRPARLKLDAARGRPGRVREARPCPGRVRGPARFHAVRGGAAGRGEGARRRIWPR